MEGKPQEKGEQTLRSSSGLSLGGEGNHSHGNTSGGQQFDFLNWLYWNLWWQQYTYWNMVHSQSFSQNWNGTQPPAPGTGQQPPSNMNTAPQWNTNAGMGPFMRPPPLQTVRTRIVSGYESYIAPLWRRGVAEIIDTILVGLVLKMFLPKVDYRVPELVFEGSDMWDEMTAEDLEDAKDTLLLFLYSTLLHRGLHVVLEALFLCVFACTPGKWLMRLAVWRCASTPAFTRTSPGYSIKVEPAGQLSFLLSLGRSLFKSSVSLVIPLVIFFFHLERGRTQYDRLFGCVVVDTYSLNKPVYRVVDSRTEDR